MYVYNANFIMTEPLKNSTGPEISRAYKGMFEILTAWGFKPKIHCLEEESLSIMKHFNQVNELY